MVPLLQATSKPTISMFVSKSVYAEKMTMKFKTNERLPKPRYLVFYSVFPFAISFANLSRCRVFLSRHPCVWNSLSRAFAGNTWQQFPVFRSEVRIETFDSKHNGHSFAAVITVATSGSILHLVASSSFTSSSSTPPSTASSRSQWALPDLNRERQISVGTAGPQLRPRISVGTARHHGRQISVGTATPLSNGGGPSQLVRAFADLSRSFREAFADFRVTSIEICE